MVAWLKGALVAAAVCYIAVLLALWLLQGKLLYPAPQDRPPTPDGFVEIELVAADGVRTRALYRAADEGKPTLVYWHGNGDSLHGSLAANRLFQADGYGLLLPEFRGYGGNEGTPTEMGFYQDGRAAMQFLQDEGVGPEQTVISAYSIGTGLAVQMATEHRPAALMLNAPFRSLTTLVSEKFPWLPVSLLLRDRYESESKLAGFDAPLLVTHGSADTLIPPAHGKALSENVRGAAFIEFEGLGHNQMIADPIVQAQHEWLRAQLRY